MLDARTTELIAIGAACTANCVPCLKYHVGKAREAGVEDSEIHEAIRVGRMVRKGASGSWDKEVATLLETDAAAASAAP
jgi:AhpD family alkylhydroperoxidase